MPDIPVIPAEWLAFMSRLPPEGGPSGGEWAGQAQRLMREGTPGELVIMNHHGSHDAHDGNAVLRQPLP